jgi:hypothetical protein
VRRDKAALFQWVNPQPVTFAPAGSNRSSHGGNEVAEASDVKDRYRRFRECAGRNVNEHRASLEKDIAQVDPAAIPGKADTVGETSEEYP